MAEQEVIKHTKKIYKVWNDKQIKIWHKLKEIFVEIIIIVFAVSISIWFHSWNEHKHEQKQVRTFLLALKKDVESDITYAFIIKLISVSDSALRDSYIYLSKLDEKVKPDTGKLRSKVSAIYVKPFLREHKSMFNSFISSGKFVNIENEELFFQILKYYQELIPSLQTYEDYWTSQKNELLVYLNDNVKESNILAYWKVLVTPKAKRLISNLIPNENSLKNYENVVTEGKKIIDAIDKEYSD